MLAITVKCTYAIQMMYTHYIHFRGRFDGDGRAWQLFQWGIIQTVFSTCSVASVAFDLEWAGSWSVNAEWAWLCDVLHGSPCCFCLSIVRCMQQPMPSMTQPIQHIMLKLTVGQCLKRHQIHEGHAFCFLLCWFDIEWQHCYHANGNELLIQLFKHTLLLTPNVVTKF